MTFGIVYPEDQLLLYFIKCVLLFTCDESHGQTPGRVFMKDAVMKPVLQHGVGRERRQKVCKTSLLRQSLRYRN